MQKIRKENVKADGTAREKSQMWVGVGLTEDWAINIMEQNGQGEGWQEKGSEKWMVGTQDTLESCQQECDLCLKTITLDTGNN